MIIAIENPFDPDPLSKLSIAEMERELEEIMERSGFIMPPRAIALQDELGKRRARRLSFNSTFGKIATGGLKRGELAVISGSTTADKSGYSRARLEELYTAEVARHDREFVEELLKKPIPRFSKEQMEQFVASRAPLHLDPLPIYKHKRRYYDAFMTDEAGGFSGTATEWFNQQYMQQPQPEVAIKPTTFGLLPAPRGIEPMTFEKGKELVADAAKRYMSYHAEAWRELKDLTATIQPAIVTAKALTVEDIQQMGRGLREHIFDDDVTRMYPYDARLFDSSMFIDIPKPSWTQNTVEFKIAKNRDASKMATKLTFDVTTNRLDFMSDELS